MGGSGELGALAVGGLSPELSGRNSAWAQSEGATRKRNKTVKLNVRTPHLPQGMSKRVSREAETVQKEGMYLAKEIL